MGLDAILWDFDGTLANSARKNIEITKEILAVVAPHKTGDNLPQCLRNEADYHVADHASSSWRELYQNHFGLSEEEIRIAGPLWAPFQAANKTEISLYDDIREALTASAHIAHGIISLNSEGNIRNFLKENGIEGLFRSVLGYDSVPDGFQKPDAFSGIKCLETILGSNKPDKIMYVGDHELDVRFAHNLRQALDGPEVVSVTVSYSNSCPDRWILQPDHVARDGKELLQVIATHQ